MSQRQSNKDLQMKKVKCRKDAELGEILHKLNSLNELDYSSMKYELIKGKVESIISSQPGSVILQAIVLNACPRLIKSVYLEMRSTLIDLLRQTYANYFCQSLFSKLDLDCKHEFVVCIFSNLSLLLKNMISFRAIISILEQNPIPSKTRKTALKFFMKIPPSELLTHIRYIKTIETLLPKMDDQELNNMILMVSPIFKELLGLKQGYFLIKKIIKRSESDQLKMQIILIIKQIGAPQFLSNNNGYLLSKCILKNFLGYDKLSHTPEQDLSTYSTTQDKIKEISSQIEDFLFKDEDEDNSQEDSFSKEICKKGENLPINSIKASCEDKAVIAFFDLIMHELIFVYSNMTWSKTLNKLHRKVVSFFLDLNFGFFRQRLFKALIETEKMPELTSKILGILMLFQDTPIITELISSDPLNLRMADFIQRLTIINPSILPKALQVSWKKFLSSEEWSHASVELFNSKSILVDYATLSQKSEKFNKDSKNNEIKQKGKSDFHGNDDLFFEEFIPFHALTKEHDPEILEEKKLSIKKKTPSGQSITSTKISQNINLYQEYIPYSRYFNSSIYGQEATNASMNEAYSFYSQRFYPNYGNNINMNIMTQKLAMPQPLYQYQYTYIMPGQYGPTASQLGWKIN